jgi:hypothetical protein
MSAHSGNHPDSDGQLAGLVSDAIQRLKLLQQRIPRIDQALSIAKDQLGRRAD